MTPESDPHSWGPALALAFAAAFVLVEFLPGLRGIASEGRVAAGPYTVTTPAQSGLDRSPRERAVRPRPAVTAAVARAKARNAKSTTQHVDPPAPVASATEATPPASVAPPAATVPTAVAPVEQRVPTAQQQPPISSAPPSDPVPSAPRAPVKTSPQPEGPVPFDEQGTTPGSNDRAVQFDDSGAASGPTR